MRNNIIIVGCGPAGLLAAWAAQHQGYRPIILGGADPVMSKLHGAQYLHTPVHGLTEPEEAFGVKYVKHGTALGYAQKIYHGAVAPESTSWVKFAEGEHAAYPLHAVYSRLWQHFCDREIYAINFTMQLLPMFQRLGAGRVISTMPLNRLMGWLHFTSETVLIDDTHCLEGVGDDEIHYYGNQDVSAYRSSNIKGIKSIEYPATALGVYQECQSVAKPLAARDAGGRLVGARHAGVDLLGRYGRWQKGVLVDDAYRQTLEILRQL